ncbi:hypothetical protein AB4Y42_34175 [Paraburkholderia sp. EG286B]|uniref:hypothetical protein n=1 Tax=Paraburkholderia sp. EG286B TaxID=3237011 RepID=UPI0034D2A1C3
MVYVFFCVSGAIGPLNLDFSLPKREGAMANMRRLESDVLLLAETLLNYSGVVIVVGNAWPFHYSLDSLRQAFATLGQRVVNFVNTLSDTQEEAILDFMKNRSDSFVILASSEFEFSDITSSRRVSINPEVGFDEAARRALAKQLQEFGELATRPLSDDEMLRATVGAYALRRARQLISPMRARNDRQFQRRLRSLVGEN